MNDDWPPDAPEIGKDFERAHDGKKDEVAANPSPIVSRKEIEELEKQIRKPEAQLNLTPPGMPVVKNRDVERAARMEKMKQRMLENRGKAREDFGRSAEM